MSWLHNLRRAWIAFRLDDLERKRASVSHAIGRLIQKEIQLRNCK